MTIDEKIAKLEIDEKGRIKYLPTYLKFTIDEYEVLINKNLITPQWLLEKTLMGFNPHGNVNILELVDLAIKNGAQMDQVKSSYLYENISVDDFRGLVERGLNPIIHLNIILDQEISSGLVSQASATGTTDNSFLIPSFKELVSAIQLNETYIEHLFSRILINAKSSIPSVINIIKTLVQLPIDINKILENFIKREHIDVDSTEILIPVELLEFINNLKPIKPELILEYGISKRVLAIIDLAFKLNVDIHAKTQDNENTILEFAVNKFMDNDCSIIDLLIAHGADKKINFEIYIETIARSSISEAAEIIKRFPEVYNEQVLRELLRSYGVSHTLVNAFIDNHKLAIDYIQKNLSLGETDILDPKADNQDVHFEVTNAYGYGPLHLALLAHKFDLAIELINDGWNINTQSLSGSTPLQIICNIIGYIKDKPLKQKIVEAIYDKIADVDCAINGHDETIADLLLKSDFADRALERTNDPLFSLIKKDANLEIPQDGHTHIAISNSDGFWSQGMWSTARLIMKNHPTVKFHLIEQSMLDRGGEQFLSQFDAVINPGGVDGYPRGVPEFSKLHCSFELDLEKMWQQVADMSHKLGIPYLGMCAGAQHLALYHDSTLMPLEGYSKGDHEIRFLKGSISYFLAMTSEQRVESLKSGIFPEIVFRGDTAHHYAAKQLGSGLMVGGISEHNVNMAYSHLNGIRFATQFHPEHHYGTHANQTAWFDNFVRIAACYHEARSNPAIDPCAQEKALAWEFFATEATSNLVDQTLGEVLVQFEQLTLG